MAEDKSWTTIIAPDWQIHESDTKFKEIENWRTLDIEKRFVLTVISISAQKINLWICKSGATIVVQLLSSASQAPTSYFPLIKTLNNNYNFVQFLSAVQKYWSYWEEKVSQYQEFFKALKVAAVVLL